MDRIGTAVEFFKQQLRRRGTDEKSDVDRVDPVRIFPKQLEPTLRPDPGPVDHVELPVHDQSVQEHVAAHRGGENAGTIVYSRTRSVDVPLAALKERRVLTVLEEGALSSAYRTLCAHVLHQMNEKQWNVLGVTSPGRGEGKTLTALNLAISLAMESQFTVLLVDGDLSHPGVHELFGLGAAGGLSDYLLRDTPVEELLVHPGIRRLTVLPAGPRLANPAQLLGSGKMRALAAELKQRYPSRMIIYDLAALQRAADVLAVSSCLDAVLLVVEAGRTRVHEVEHAVRLLHGVPLLGTLLNKG